MFIPLIAALNTTKAATIIVLSQQFMAFSQKGKKKNKTPRNGTKTFLLITQIRYLFYVKLNMNRRSDILDFSLVAALFENSSVYLKRNPSNLPGVINLSHLGILPLISSSSSSLSTKTKVRNN